MKTLKETNDALIKLELLITEALPLGIHLSSITKYNDDHLYIQVMLSYQKHRIAFTFSHMEIYGTYFTDDFFKTIVSAKADQLKREANEKIFEKIFKERNRNDHTK